MDAIIDAEEFYNLNAPKVDKNACAVCQKPESGKIHLLRCSNCRKVAYCAKRLTGNATNRSGNSDPFVLVSCSRFDQRGSHAGQHYELDLHNLWGERAEEKYWVEIHRDLTAYANSHNEHVLSIFPDSESHFFFRDTNIVAAWLAMDLHNDIRTADTHFFAITLRLLPFAVWDALWEERGVAAELPGGGHQMIRPSQIQQNYKAQFMKDGHLGSVLVTTVELRDGEDKPVLQAVLESINRGYALPDYSPDVPAARPVQSAPNCIPISSSGYCSMAVFCTLTTIPPSSH
ncbi:hypothetical protein BKA62DRAFT_673572 [Auriculariales sp. MPI-PUGE-AT-0066]|nr:hypothetical protein BKA62DRAFT_673572 [Auriculariales sp. MPI-PUGE-AT-0066]